MSDKENDLIEARRDYTANTLTRVQLASTPLDQFTQWMKDARAANIIDASAMALCTADQSGAPHSRMVLLKKASDEGFVWYTYQESDKGRQLEENPQASLLFYWRELERQVRIEGSVVKLDSSDADQYFYSRPEGSRFSAAASIQSSRVEDRSVLEKRVAQLHEQHPDGKVPRPDVWAGYLLQAKRFEFWQGRADRLHDRFVYTSATSSSDAVRWQIDRLSP